MKLGLIVFLFIVIIGSSYANEVNIDSLTNVLVEKIKTKEYDKSSKKIYDIIIRYLHRTEPLDAIDYHYKLIQIGNKYDNSQFVAANYVSIGSIYREQGLSGRAMEYYFKAMKYMDESQHGNFCWLYIFIGNVYFSEELFIDAMKFYKMADSGFDSLGYDGEKIINLKNRDKYWSDLGKAVANNNIALCYQNLDNIDSAMYFFKHGLSIRKRQKQIFGIAHSYLYVGEMYFQTAQYDLALNTYTHSLRLFDSSLKVEQEFRMETKANYAKCLYLISLVHEKLGHFGKAESYLRMSIDSLLAINDKGGLANRYMDLSDFYNHNKNIEKAIEYAIISHDLSLEYDLYIPALRSTIALQELYNSLKYFNEVINYTKKYDIIKDKVHDKFNEFSIREISTRIENEKKLIELEKDKAVKESNISQQRTIIILLSLFLIFVIIGIILFWKKLKIIRKLNESLEENNQLLLDTNNKLKLSEKNLENVNSEIKNKNYELIQSEINLKELNATKDKFFSIIAHDLKNPFISFKDVLELLDNEYDDLEEEDKRLFISEMAKSSRYLYSLLENLLTWSRSQRGKIDFTPEYSNFKNIIDSNIAFLKMNAEQKDIKLTSEVHDDLFATFDGNMMLTIFRNLISNAIKFTPRSGKIIVGAEISDKRLKAFVKDTGVGMPKEVINKLFRIDINHTTLGTDREKGTGIGLILCKEFLDMHSGRIWAESNTGTGSTFCIEFPIE